MNIDHFLQSKEKSEYKLEKLFLYHFLDFTFIYDDELRTCKIECPISEPLLNELGTIHGGIYTFIADAAIGHLLNYFLSAPHVTLEIKTSFLKSASSGNLIATASFVKEGRNIVFTQCEISDGNDILTVTTGTFYRPKKV